MLYFEMYKVTCIYRVSSWGVEKRLTTNLRDDPVYLTICLREEGACFDWFSSICICATSASCTAEHIFQLTAYLFFSDSASTLLRGVRSSSRGAAMELRKTFLKDNNLWEMSRSHHILFICNRTGKQKSVFGYHKNISFSNKSTLNTQKLSQCLQMEDH